MTTSSHAWPAKVRERERETERHPRGASGRHTAVAVAAVTKNYAQIKDRCVAKPSDQQNAVEALDDLFMFLFRIDLSLKMSVEKVGSAYLFVMTLFVLCTVCIDVVV